MQQQSTRGPTEGPRRAVATWRAAGVQQRGRQPAQPRAPWAPAALTRHWSLVTPHTVDSLIQSHSRSLCISYMSGTVGLVTLSRCSHTHGEAMLVVHDSTSCPAAMAGWLAHAMTKLCWLCAKIFDACAHSVHRQHHRQCSSSTQCTGHSVPAAFKQRGWQAPGGRGAAMGHPMNMQCLVHRSSKWPAAARCCSSRQARQRAVHLCSTQARLGQAGQQLGQAGRASRRCCTTAATWAVQLPLPAATWLASSLCCCHASVQPQPWRASHSGQQAPGGWHTHSRTHVHTCILPPPPTRECSHVCRHSQPLTRPTAAPHHRHMHGGGTAA